MARPHVVEVATYTIARAPAKLACMSLGSCVGIALYDGRSGLGGLAHPMLPLFAEGKNRRSIARYVDTAIYLMLDELIERGVLKKHLRAKIAGGAQMFGLSGPGGLHIGERNVESARNTLAREGIRIQAEDTGGRRGRTIVMDLRTWRMSVRTIGGEVYDI